MQETARGIYPERQPKKRNFFQKVLDKVRMKVVVSKNLRFKGAGGARQPQ